MWRTPPRKNPGSATVSDSNFLHILECGILNIVVFIS